MEDLPYREGRWQWHAPAVCWVMEVPGCVLPSSSLHASGNICMLLVRCLCVYRGVLDCKCMQWCLQLVKSALCSDAARHTYCVCVCTCAVCVQSTSVAVCICHLCSLMGSRSAAEECCVMSSVNTISACGTCAANNPCNNTVCVCCVSAHVAVCDARLIWFEAAAVRQPSCWWLTGNTQYVWNS